MERSSLLGAVGSTSTRDTVVIAGPSGSGKTALFYKLTGHRSIETCVSMQENVAPLANNMLNTKLVDIPGHLRLRFKFNTFLPSAKGILFVVDSSQLRKEDILRSTSEYLYDVLTNNTTLNSELPVHILCNKNDVILSLTPALVKSMLEQEINQLRKARSSGIAAQSEGDEDVAYLGHEEDFKFEHLSNEVTFASISCKPISAEQDIDNSTDSNKNIDDVQMVFETIAEW
ncbi:hypothetical protein BDEG_27035 [Batrachochytrium dendrobatidis JEL423]|uniref:Signal recognition particle receptor subunit beta n=1 Tax=Batrachochytrium dendrobatidis (strain JEL423) TaxID=403673 RepID=A0A177WVJ8_BATDL|nr:hypothetical protein BDEG_27035 [Batrachochytrium dendrobatidis JEL423]